MCSNIPSGTAYGVYISQLIRYSRCCMFYKDFCERHVHLVRRLLTQGFTVTRLKKTFNRFFDNYGEFISKYKVCKEVMSIDAELFVPGIEFGSFLFEVLASG